MSALFIYQTIIEDLTRRFDRIEAALEALLDLNLPEWAEIKITAALRYAECSVQERDDLDEMAANRCVCETFTVHAGDPDEPDRFEDDTQNDYADDSDPDEDEDDDDDPDQARRHRPWREDEDAGEDEDGDPDTDGESDIAEPDEDEFDRAGAPHRPDCPCGQHPAPAAVAVVQPAPLIADDDKPYRPRFGNPADIALAHNKRGRR